MRQNYLCNNKCAFAFFLFFVFLIRLFIMTFDSKFLHKFSQIDIARFLHVSFTGSLFDVINVCTYQRCGFFALYCVQKRLLHKIDSAVANFYRQIVYDRGKAIFFETCLQHENCQSLVIVMVHKNIWQVISYNRQYEIKLTFSWQCIQMAGSSILAVVKLLNHRINVDSLYIKITHKYLSQLMEIAKYTDESEGDKFWKISKSVATSNKFSSFSMEKWFSFAHEGQKEEVVFGPREFKTLLSLNAPYLW